MLSEVESAAKKTPLRARGTFFSFFGISPFVFATVVAVNVSVFRGATYWKDRCYGGLPIARAGTARSIEVDYKSNVVWRKQ
jgi:hypothetical protein